ncbi:MAG TPA: sigma-54 dependent transcriptional regulator [Blastocatellia bacterium]|nr:sigma-54 dependent transcriptional regulator [Blastocatellia bacterium]
MKPVVLIVDDEPAARFGMKRALEKEGYTILEADSLAGADRVVEEQGPGVVLLDVRLASESGLDYLPGLVSKDDPPVVIIVTAHGSERTAVQAIKLGAYDYLSKPFDVDELRILVKNAIETHLLRAENANLRRKLAATGTFGQLIGSSPVMEGVYSLIEKVAPTDVNVLLTGESGTGKEMVAREIHARSRNASGPFVSVNCAAMPGELIESELFGHEKGAFTGAAGRRVGKFEAATGGTLFLDEIGDMSLATQAKVLRAIEEKTFQRLGSNTTLSTEARIISATNKPLESEVEAGRFREDLFYRLCVVRINLPPLRERKSDIPALTQSFCERFSLAYKNTSLRISKEALKVLLEYDWPGNARQLRNCIERAIVLTDSEEITVDALPEEIFSARTPGRSVTESADGITVSKSLDFRSAKKEFERQYVEYSLDQAGGNVTRAAAALGMHRQSLQHKIKELGLSKRFVIDD